MTEITEILKYSANLVKLWGKSRLPSGSTLSEMLTVNGIPFWDSFAVDLARVYVPKALSSDPLASTVTNRIRPYLSQAKHKIKGFFSYRKNQEGCSGWPPNPVLLSLGFSDYIYKDVLQPVVARLAEHQDCQIVVLNDTQWPHMGLFENHNVTYQTIWQHWDKKIGQKASVLKQALCKIESELKTSNILSQIMCDTDPCTSKSLGILFNLFFRVYLPLFVPQAVVAKHILENHHPNIVISPDVADPRTRIYSILSRQIGIPCMEIQFGLTDGDGIEWQFLTADRVAVWGESSKEVMLTHHGVPAERIVITGSPRHDYPFNVPDEEVNTKRSQLNVPNDKIILLASTYHLKAYEGYSNPEILRLMKRAIFKAADQTQRICLVVKPHPQEDVREIHKLAGVCKNIIVVEKDSDIRDWIRICDAFISFGSSATIDALIGDKLSICPAFPGWIWSDFFKKSRATLVPESDEEIMGIFQMVANGSHHNIKARLESARQDFLKRCVYRTDGMATARVEALALQMAGIGGI